MSKTVVVVSVHPDDEVIGAGGTLLKHKRNGDSIFWIIITCITESGGFTADRIKERDGEIAVVAKMLQVQRVFQLQFPTMTLSSESLIKLVPDISKIFTQVNPEIIYCVNRSDAHSDHRVAFDAVMANTKSFRFPSIKQVLMYECVSETEFAPALPEKAFIPNHFVDVSEFIDQKFEILKVYKSELGDHPFPRSIKNIEALATFRGAFAGVKYAEAFQIIKSIDK